MENQEKETVENQEAVDVAVDVAGETAATGPEQTVYTEERVATLVAEAEQRGYLRGRNEKIEMELSARGLFEQPDDTATAAHAADPRNPCDMLSYIRPSVWD